MQQTRHMGVINNQTIAINVVPTHMGIVHNSATLEMKLSILIQGVAKVPEIPFNFSTHHASIICKHGCAIEEKYNPVPNIEDPYMVDVDSKEALLGNAGKAQKNLLNNKGQEDP